MFSTPAFPSTLLMVRALAPWTSSPFDTGQKARDTPPRVLVPSEVPLSETAILAVADAGRERIENTWARPASSLSALKFTVQVSPAIISFETSCHDPSPSMVCDDPERIPPNSDDESLSRPVLKIAGRGMPKASMTP